MEPEQYEALQRLEDRHWWYEGNRRVARGVLSHFEVPESGARILDVGCGTGGNLRWLTSLGECCGVDVSPLALAQAATVERATVIEGMVEQLPFADGSFDLTTCFEVLYHREVANPANALRELARVTRVGGHLLIREPAFAILRGSHDAAVHGARRFRKREFRGLLRHTGWEPKVLSYANASLFLPALVLRALRRDGDSDDLDYGTGWGLGTRVLAGILAAERPFLARGLLPFGSSIFALAVRT